MGAGPEIGAVINRLLFISSQERDHSGLNSQALLERSQ